MSADFAAFAYCQFSRSLHRYLMRRLANAQSAQDLAQEAYLRLVRVSDAVLVQAPQAYLFRIASNLVSERALRERREIVLFDSPLVETVLHVAEVEACEVSERIYAEQLLFSMLGQLPSLHAAILILRKRDGKSCQEIAQELRLSPHTVKSYLARAVAQCRLLARDYTC